MVGRALKQLFQILAIIAIAGGCATIRGAREAQRDPELLAKAGLAEATGRRSRLDLTDLDLEGLVNFALTNRPNVKIASLAVERARLALADAKGGGLMVPQLDASLGHSQSTLNRDSHFSWRNRGGGAGSISADILIWDFGRMEAAQRAAGEELVAARRTLEETRLSVFSEVAESYFAVLRADALLEVALTNEMEYAGHLERSERLLEAGEAKKLDVSRARVDLSAAHLAAVNASNETETCGIALLKALGIDPGCAGRFDVLARPSRALECGRRQFDETHFPADAALDLARTNSPTLLALRAKLRAASADVDRAIADLYPEISVSSSFSWSDPVWNWSWALNAVTSLFRGFRKLNAVDDAVAAMRSAGARVAEAEQELSQQLALAIAERDNARASFADAAVMVDRAKENLDLVEAEYALGEANRVDFTDAVAAYTLSLGEKIKAFYAGEIAEVKLVELIGRR